MFAARERRSLARRSAARISAAFLVKPRVLSRASAFRSASKIWLMDFAPSEQQHTRFWLKALHFSNRSPGINLWYRCPIEGCHEEFETAVEDRHGQAFERLYPSAYPNNNLLIQ